MTERKTQAARTELQALVSITRDSKVRRELLWLRAMEKGDEESAKSLERADAGLESRIRALYEAEMDEAELLVGRARREVFAELWHRHRDLGGAA